MRAFLSFYVPDMAGRVPAACKGEKCVLCSEHTMLPKAGAPMRQTAKARMQECRYQGGWN